MATRAESLIRQFCTARRTEIEAETKAVKEKVPASINVKDLPGHLQRRIVRLRQLRQQADTIRAQLVSRYGFNEYELQQRRSKLTNPAAGAQHDALNKHRSRRLGDLDRVQQTAYIAVMGRTPGEARIIIEELQKALRKI